MTMKQATSKTQTHTMLWGMPVLLALLSGAGLLLALLAEDGWHLLAWLGVAAPLLAVSWCAWRSHRPPQSSG
jgi:hypothetical protein